MKEAIDALVAFYEGLRPESVAEIRVLYAPDARFKDPFNDVHGHDAIARVFEHMFETVSEPRFKVVGRVEDEGRAALEWTFDFTLRGRALSIRGASLLRFDARGRVSEHLDYWDTGEELYAKLAAIGPVVKWIRRRMSATGT